MRLDAFREVYEARVRDILARWTREMQIAIARHCAGWHPDRFDFPAYFHRSARRFHLAYEAVLRHGATTAVDVGGFWGVFPLTLKDLGVRVVMTEALRYYDRAFDPLFDYLRGEGLEIVDYDPFDPAASAFGRFDAVCAMAVLEHYPHSLRSCMTQLRGLVSERGFLYVEVPNIGYWPKRWNFLLHGATPLAPIDEIWDSEVPFIGHHHEFTIHELRRLAALSQMQIVAENFYNYSSDPLPWRELVRRPWLHAMPLVVPRTRELLSVVLRPS